MQLYTSGAGARARRGGARNARDVPRSRHRTVLPALPLSCAHLAREVFRLFRYEKTE